MFRSLPTSLAVLFLPAIVVLLAQPGPSQAQQAWWDEYVWNDAGQRRWWDEYVWGDKLYGDRLYRDLYEGSSGDEGVYEWGALSERYDDPYDWDDTPYDGQLYDEYETYDTLGYDSDAYPYTPYDLYDLGVYDDEYDLYDVYDYEYGPLGEYDPYDLYDAPAAYQLYDYGTAFPGFYSRWYRVFD